jgi:hypothetical protein
MLFKAIEVKMILWLTNMLPRSNIIKNDVNQKKSCSTRPVAGIKLDPSEWSSPNLLAIIYHK